MARVVSLLEQARAAGLDVRRDGDDLVVRGPAVLGRLARELLSHKPLVLAVLEHEDECREHERSEHLGQHVDWRLTAEGALVCCVCHPASSADPRGAGGEGGTTGRPPCVMCKSTGRCEGRVVMPDGGWVCLAAVADGVLRNGRLHGPGRPPAAGAGR
jgi:hypothetical protein